MILGNQSAVRRVARIHTARKHTGQVSIRLKSKTNEDRDKDGGVSAMSPVLLNQITQGTAVSQMLTQFHRPPPHRKLKGKYRKRKRKGEKEGRKRRGRRTKKGEEKESQEKTTNPSDGILVPPNKQVPLADPGDGVAQADREGENRRQVRGKLVAKRK